MLGTNGNCENFLGFRPQTLTSNQRGDACNGRPKRAKFWPARPRKICARAQNMKSENMENFYHFHILFVLIKSIRVAHPYFKHFIFTTVMTKTSHYSRFNDYRWDEKVKKRDSSPHDAENNLIKPTPLKISHFSFKMSQYVFPPENFPYQLCADVARCASFARCARARKIFLRDRPSAKSLINLQ